MGKVLVERSSLQGVANAIRQKTGGDEILRFKPSEMEQGILDIPQGITPVGTKTVLNNGNNIDVETYKYVDVNVQPPLEDKEVTVSAGDEITVEPSSGKYGLSSVTVNVNDVTLKDILITSDNTYEVPAGFDGYGTITVNTGVEPTVDIKTVTQAYGTTETYIATDDDVDGYSQITVTATAPTGDITINSNGTYDVKDKARAIVSLQTQSKTVSVDYGDQVTITPDTNKLLSSVTVTATEPEGNKAITSNGTNINVKDYATVSVNVPNGTETLEATENYHTYTPTGSNIGFSSVTVNVTPNLQDKTIASNGTYAADVDYDGLGTVNVNVPIAPKATTITSNGTYNASDESLSGFSSVTVDIASGLTYAEVTNPSGNNNTLTFTLPSAINTDPNIAYYLEAQSGDTSTTTAGRIYIFKQLRLFKPSWYTGADNVVTIGGYYNKSTNTWGTDTSGYVTFTRTNNTIQATTSYYFLPNTKYRLYYISNN